MENEIKLGEKAIAILKGISNIYQGVIIKDDYLYTKFENTLETSGKKGSEDIIVNYDLPAGEVQIPQEFGLDDINEFLSVMKSFGDDLSVTLEGTAIVMKDKRKQVQYFTRTTESLPSKNPAGDQLFNSEPNDKVLFTLLESEKEQIIKDLNILKADKIVLSCEGGVIHLKASNKITGNETKIKLSKENTHTCVDGFDFELPNPSILSLIIPGEVYEIQIKEVQYNGNGIKIMKLYNKTLEDGSLSYTMIAT